MPRVGGAGGRPLRGGKGALGTDLGLLLGNLLLLAAALIRAVIDGGPVALAVKRFSPRVCEEVEAAFLTSVAAHLQPDGSYRIPGEFVTVAADKPI